MPARWDAVVIGAGQNGLVAASYLARAGKRTLVLEARDVVGGACVTEELIPALDGRRVPSSRDSCAPRSSRSSSCSASVSSSTSPT